MTVHVPTSIDDAMVMLDSRVPLTYAERKMIVEGLWNLAFEKGVEAERKRLRDLMVKALDDVKNKTILGAPEYEDPTTSIRRKLEFKSRSRGPDGFPCDDSYLKSPDGPHWPETYPYRDREIS